MTLPLGEWWFWVIVLLASPYILVATLGVLAIVGETLTQIAEAITGSSNKHKTTGEGDKE